MVRAARTALTALMFQSSATFDERVDDSCAAAGAIDVAATNRPIRSARIIRDVAFKLDRAM
jgi:hypothetical protein